MDNTDLCAKILALCENNNCGDGRCKLVPHILAVLDDAPDPSPALTCPICDGKMRPVETPPGLLGPLIQCLECGTLCAARNTLMTHAPVATTTMGEHWRCPTCGPHVRIDEDGCCMLCGEDCTVEPCDCVAVAVEAMRAECERVCRHRARMMREGLAPLDSDRAYQSVAAREAELCAKDIHALPIVNGVHPEPRHDETCARVCPELAEHERCSTACCFYTASLSSKNTCGAHKKEPMKIHVTSSKLELSEVVTARLHITNGQVVTVPNVRFIEWETKAPCEDNLMEHPRCPQCGHTSERPPLSEVPRVGRWSRYGDGQEIWLCDQDAHAEGTESCPCCTPSYTRPLFPEVPK